MPPEGVEQFFRRMVDRIDLEKELIAVGRQIIRREQMADFQFRLLYALGLDKSLLRYAILRREEKRS